MSRKSRVEITKAIELTRSMVQKSSPPRSADVKELQTYEAELAAYDLQTEQELKTLSKNEMFTERLGKILGLKKRLELNQTQIYRSLAIRRQRNWLYLQLYLCNLQLEIYSGKHSLEQLPVTDQQYTAALINRINSCAQEIQVIRKKINFLHQEYIQWREATNQRQGTAVDDEKEKSDLLALVKKVLEQGGSLENYDVFSLVNEEIRKWGLREKVDEQETLIQEIKTATQPISVERVTQLFTKLNTSYSGHIAHLSMAANLYDEIPRVKYQRHQQEIASCEGKETTIRPWIVEYIREQKNIAKLKALIAFKYLRYDRWTSGMSILLLDTVPTLKMLQSMSFPAPQVFIRVKSLFQNSIYFIDLLTTDTISELVLAEGQTLVNFDDKASTSSLSKNVPRKLTPGQELDLREFKSHTQGQLERGSSDEDSRVYGNRLIDSLGQYLSLISYKGNEGIKQSDEVEQLEKPMSLTAWKDFFDELYERLEETAPAFELVDLTDKEKLELKENFGRENTDNTSLRENASTSSPSRRKGEIQAGLGAQKIETVVQHLSAFRTCIDQDIKDIKGSSPEVFAAVTPPPADLTELKSRGIITPLPAVSTDKSGKIANPLIQLMSEINEVLQELVSELTQKAKQVKHLTASLEKSKTEAKKASLECDPSTDSPAKKANKQGIPSIMSDLEATLAPVSTTDKYEARTLPETKFSGMESLSATTEDAWFADLIKRESYSITEFREILLQWSTRKKLADGCRPIQEKILQSILYRDAPTWSAEAKQKDDRLVSLTKLIEEKKAEASIWGIAPHFFESLIGAPLAPALGLIARFQHESKAVPGSTVSVYDDMRKSLEDLEGKLVGVRSKKLALDQMGAVIKKLQTTEKEIIPLLVQGFTELAKSTETAQTEFSGKYLKFSLDLENEWNDLEKIKGQDNYGLAIQMYVGKIGEFMSSINSKFKETSFDKDLQEALTRKGSSVLVKHQLIQSILAPFFKWGKRSLKSERDSASAAIFTLHGLSVVNPTPDIKITLTAERIIAKIEEQEKEEKEKEKKGQNVSKPLETSQTYKLDAHIVELFKKIKKRGGLEAKHVEEFLQATQGVEQLAIGLLLAVEKGQGERVSVKSDLYNLILKECAGKSLAAKRHFLIGKCSSYILTFMRDMRAKEEEVCRLQQRLGIAPPVSHSQFSKDSVDTLINIRGKIGELNRELNQQQEIIALSPLPEYEVEQLKTEKDSLEKALKQTKQSSFTGCVGTFIDDCYKSHLGKPLLKVGQPIKSTDLEQMLDLPPSPTPKRSAMPVTEEKKIDDLNLKKLVTERFQPELDKEGELLDGLSAFASEADELSGAPAAPTPKPKLGERPSIKPRDVIVDIQRISVFSPDNKRLCSVPDSLIRLVNAGTLSQFIQVWFSAYLMNDITTFTIKKGKQMLRIGKKREVLGNYLQENKKIRREDEAGRAIHVLVQSPCFDILNPLTRFTKEQFSELQLMSTESPHLSIWHILFATLKASGLAGNITDSRILYKIVMEGREDDIDEKKNINSLLKQVTQKLKIKIFVFSALDSVDNRNKCSVTSDDPAFKTGIFLALRGEGYRPLIPTKCFSTLSEKDIISLFESPELAKLPPKKKSKKKPVSSLAPTPTPTPTSTPTLMPTTPEPPPKIPDVFGSELKFVSLPSYSMPSISLDWEEEILSLEQSKGVVVKVTKALNQKNSDDSDDLDDSANLDNLDIGVTMLTGYPIRVFMQFLSSFSESPENFEKHNVTEIKKSILKITGLKEGSVVPPQKQKVMQILTNQFLEAKYDENKLVAYIIDQIKRAVYGVIPETKKVLDKTSRQQAVDNVKVLLMGCPVEIFIKIYVHIEMAVQINSKGQQRALRFPGIIEPLTEALQTEDGKSMPSAKRAAMEFLMTLPCIYLKESKEPESKETSYFQGPGMDKFEKAVQVGLNMLGIKQQVPLFDKKPETIKQMVQSMCAYLKINMVVYGSPTEKVEDHPGATIYLQAYKGEYYPLIPANWLAEDQQRILTMREQVLSLSPPVSSPDSVSAAALAGGGLLSTPSKNSVSSTTSSLPPTVGSSPAVPSSTLAALSVTTTGISTSTSTSTITSSSTDTTTTPSFFSRLFGSSSSG